VVLVTEICVAPQPRPVRTIVLMISYIFNRSLHMHAYCYIMI
jgi:hypothetical protein